MSWQGNECFVFGIDHVSDNCEEQMLENMSELLYLYGEHGPGWYLCGNMYDDGTTEDDYFPFEPKSYDGSPLFDFCWIPNPFMFPPVFAVKVRNPHDLLGVAFECWDSSMYTIAYAGDGDEPLERLVIYGEEYDMRAA